jgi:hypothetical protein
MHRYPAHYTYGKRTREHSVLRSFFHIIVSTTVFGIKKRAVRWKIHGYGALLWKTCDTR